MSAQAAFIQTIHRHLGALLIYRDILSDPVGQAFLQLLRSLLHVNSDSSTTLQAYGAWFEALANKNQGWQEYLLDRLLTAENPFSRQVQQTDYQIPPVLLAAVKHDLQLLQSLYFCSSEQICQWVREATRSPQLVAWADDLSSLKSQPSRSTKALHLQNQLEMMSDWAEAVEILVAHYQKFGTGLFAEYQAFRWQRGQFVPIAHPDPVQVQDLVGYETQRDLLLKNTEFLLLGQPALHILLYGSRGSGKSSLVKSLLHQYGNAAGEQHSHRSLCLIEVTKSELTDLPTIVEQLRELPQKFVIFVDDLSFEEDDDAYKALKVVLEGNLTARPQNVVVYATSNRRHLIREFFGDRPRPQDADEVHNWDTVQEKLSFSDRFGLTLTFEPADQATYLKIIHHLAQQAQITLSPEELTHQALQWATRHNGRSGRTARQFIDFLRADLTVSGATQ